MNETALVDVNHASLVNGDGGSNSSLVDPRNATARGGWSPGKSDLLYVVLVYTLLTDQGFRFNNPCVGVLLRANLVLTTKSCLEVSYHGDIDYDLMFVYVRNSQVLKPEKVFFFPDISDPMPNIALILCESSTVTEFAQLPSVKFNLDDYDHCLLCGFGTDAQRLNLEGFNASWINRSEVEVCSPPHEQWTCLHFSKVISCRGDVGAPLICNGEVHAIYNPTVAKWAPPECMDTFGATFTLVHTMVPWIQRVNHTLELPMVAVFNTPWCWLGMGVTAITIIVGIYYTLMKYVDWMCAGDGNADEMEAVAVEGDGRVIYVRSSEMSRISKATTARWLWTDPRPVARK